MKTEQALQRLTEVLRRKHFALKTEQCYCAWLKRYCNYIVKLPAHLPSEQKLERFLTALAKNDVAASTQNQAFSAVIFFYQEALGGLVRWIRLESKVQSPQRLNSATAEVRARGIPPRGASPWRSGAGRAALPTEPGRSTLVIWKADK